MYEYEELLSCSSGSWNAIQVIIIYDLRILESAFHFIDKILFIVRDRLLVYLESQSTHWKMKWVSQISDSLGGN
jgi:hypothetical protein